MRFEIGLGTPGWPHILCLIIVVLSIPEFYKKLTQLSVQLFAYGYRIYTWSEDKLCWWRQKKTPEQREQEIQFKSTTPQEVAQQLKEDNEYKNISGYVSFKWGFPYIFRTRHVQLYKTVLLIRDADAMQKYNKKRLELSHQYQQQLRNQQSASSSSSAAAVAGNSGTHEVDNAQEQKDLADTADDAQEESLAPVNSRTFQPPKPLYIFNFKRGKAVNSRLPLTLKLVNTSSSMCFLEFRDRQSYAFWCTAITKNLHVDLTETWRQDARQMLSNMQHDQNLQKLQQSTPVKKRPVLTSTATLR